MSKIKSLDDLRRMKQALEQGMILREKIPAIVTQGGCMGFCYAEPTVEIKLPGQDPVVFGNVTPAKVDELVECYIRRGELTGDIIPIKSDTIHDR